MVGVYGVVVVSGMANETVGWRILVPVGVTGQALQADMRPGQRELRIRMVESGRCPGSCSMALCAYMVEIVLHVVGVNHSLEIRLMASITLNGRILVPVGVTGNTLQADMSACQRELRIGMIE
jgi:hypothetical protein